VTYLTLQSKFGSNSNVCAVLGRVTHTVPKPRSRDGPSYDADDTKQLGPQNGTPPSKGCHSAGFSFTHLGKTAMARAQTSQIRFSCVGNDLVTIPRGAARVQGHVRRLAVFLVDRAGPEAIRIAHLDEKLRKAAGLTTPQFKGAIAKLRVWPVGNPLISFIEEPANKRGAHKGAQRAHLRCKPESWVKAHEYLVHQQAVPWWVKRAIMVIRSRPITGDRFVLNATGKAWDNSLAELVPEINRKTRRQTIDWFIARARSVGIIYDIQKRAGKHQGPATCKLRDDDPDRIDRLVLAIQEMPVFPPGNADSFPSLEDIANADSFPPAQNAEMPVFPPGNIDSFPPQHVDPSLPSSLSHMYTHAGGESLVGPGQVAVLSEMPSAGSARTVAMASPDPAGACTRDTHESEHERAGSPASGERGIVAEYSDSPPCDLDLSLAGVDPQPELVPPPAQRKPRFDLSKYKANLPRQSRTPNTQAEPVLAPPCGSDGSARPDGRPDAQTPPEAEETPADQVPAPETDGWWIEAAEEMLLEALAKY
jgi:hypothetical protein